MKYLFYKCLSTFSLVQLHFSLHLPEIKLKRGNFIRTNVTTSNDCTRILGRWNTLLFTKWMRENIFPAWAHYLRHERRKSECLICANVPNTSCRIQYFLKRTLCLICHVPFVNRWRLACACQSVNRINSDLFSLFRNFHHPNWRNGVL
jgi:hypothetical protein